MENLEQKAPVSKRMKIVIIVLAVLLVLSVGGLVGRYIYLHICAPTRTTVTLPDDLIGEVTSTLPTDTGKDSGSSAAGSDPGIEQSAVGEASHPAETDKPTTDKPTAVKLELYEGKPGDNQRFEVGNMFPGDVETKYFCVNVYGDRDMPLFFRADVTEQTKALSDVLHIKVTDMETGNVLCDAPFSEVNGEEYDKLLKVEGGKATTTYYRIDVSLDTSVGNEYQAAMLKANFQWYVKDEGGLTPPPQTGDTTNTVLWMVLAISSLLLIIFLWKRKKEDRRYEQA